MMTSNIGVPRARPALDGRARHSGASVRSLQVPAVSTAASTTAPLPAPASTPASPPPAPDAAPGRPPPPPPAASHIAQRYATVTQHFPAALAADDFLSRTEMALGLCGFRGDNAIAVTNLCRDEATAILKNKVDAVFGASFNINGLGAGLTCGCLGMRAGFSHSPVTGGRERYVFFSMPHIAIDASGRIGSIHRPGRAGGPSTACGALIALLSQFKADPRAVPRYAQRAATAHNAADPELSILRNRLAHHLHRSGADVSKMYLPEFTRFAERVITADLEALIRETVDISTADYAVVTGVQVHSWPAPGTGEPLLEFVEPRVAYAVCRGVRRDLNLQNIPALTPRQLAVLRGRPPAVPAAAEAGTTVVVESKVRDRRRD